MRRPFLVARHLQATAAAARDLASPLSIILHRVSVLFYDDKWCSAPPPSLLLSVQLRTRHPISRIFHLTSRRPTMGEVTHLWRFAVKGLDRDEFPQVQLSAGLGFPNDRRWALQLQPLPQPSDDPELPPPTPFDPSAPSWMHKQYRPTAPLLSCSMTLSLQVLFVCIHGRRGAGCARDII